MPSLTPTGHSSWPDSEVEMVERAVVVVVVGVEDDEHDEESMNL